MKTIYLVRHGQSTANIGEGPLTDDAVIPLTPEGQAQARQIADWLCPEWVQPHQILVSRYLRTHQTAQPLADRAGLPLQEHPLLHEFSYISPTRVKTHPELWEEARLYWDRADAFERHGPDVETFAEFAARVRAFGEQLASLPDGTVAFTHGMWLSQLLWQQLGFHSLDPVRLRYFRAFQIHLPTPNCAVYVVQVQDDGTWRVQAHDELIARLQAQQGLDGLATRIEPVRPVV
ncbi:histidine phosphatase family protein [Amphibiibacter pelophylacis]|uniref:Histidine phosphatase family protein n=1 Tax=Amphibiibacter pelophylacis TaxID=1799477 RepID=A0ACC6P0F2_9BURK